MAAGNPRRRRVADLAGDAGVLADGSADAEVEGVDHLAVLLDLLALEADVGDPALAAGVGAAGDVQLDLLVEAGQAIFKLAGKPPGEGLGFGDGELAELGAGAAMAPRQKGSPRRASRFRRAVHELARTGVGHIDEDDVLLMVARSWPSPNCSARSASWMSWSP